MPERSIALLRGINVGGKNRIPMKDLTEIFSAAGGINVRTYIQSGNVVYEGTIQPEDVTAGIAARFGYQIPVVLRTAAAYHRAVASTPHHEAGWSEDKLFVMFLGRTPEPEHIDALDPNRSPGDSFICRNGEIYLHVPAGGAQSKLTNAWFDSRLKTVSTSRNWRTVLELQKMLG